MAENNKEAFNINEAAAFLGVHPQTIRKLARAGELPAFKVGRAWRFHRQALQKWVDTHYERNKKPLIFVVDDEKSIRDTVKLTLESAGYKAKAIGDGATLIKQLDNEPPDAIILDLAMPGVSGVQVLKEIRSMQLDIPIIILTGYPDGDLMQQALQYSPFIVIAKPTRLENLLDVLTRALGKR